MTAALAGFLLLALWLVFAPPGGPDRRLRQTMAGRAPGPARAWSSVRRWPRDAVLRRGRRNPPVEVPMTVLVLQLAALVRGGRAPARLWEELWLLYGNQGQPAAGRPGSGQFPAGHGPAEVLGGASRGILAAARAAAATGSPVAAAIRSAAAGTVAPGRRHRRPPPRELAVWVELAACFDVAEASGCPLADVLARFAAHLEAGDDAGAARQTALAGPRATVRILTWLPFLGLALGALLGVDPLAVLLGTPLGTAALVAGLVLAAAGRMWSSRLVRAAAGGEP